MDGDSVISLLINQTWQIWWNRQTVFFKDCTVDPCWWNPTIWTLLFYIKAAHLRRYHYMQHVIFERDLNHTCWYARHLKFLNEVESPATLGLAETSTVSSWLHTKTRKANEGSSREILFCLISDEKQHSDLYSVQLLRLPLTDTYIHTLQQPIALRLCTSKKLNKDSKQSLYFDRLPKYEWLPHFTLSFMTQAFVVSNPVLG